MQHQTKPNKLQRARTDRQQRVKHIHTDTDTDTDTQTHTDTHTHTHTHTHISYNILRTGGELVQSDPDHVADSTAGEAHLSEGARISSVPGLS